MLYKIQKFFGGIGRIHLIKNKGHAVYVVTKIYDLENIIVPHFINYPLLTIKIITFLFFKEIVHIIYVKDHLTIEGAEVILASRSFMNNRITEELLRNSSTFLPIILPEIKPLNVDNINSNWLVGFTGAEGCFFLNICPNRNNIGSWLTPVFSLVKHSIDTPLFDLLK